MLNCFFFNSYCFKDDPASNIAVSDAYKDAKDYPMRNGRCNTMSRGLIIEPKRPESNVSSLNIEATPTNGETIDHTNNAEFVKKDAGTIDHTNNVEFVKKDDENPGFSNIEQIRVQIKPIVNLEYFDSKASKLHPTMAPENGELNLKLLEIHAIDKTINIFNHRRDFSGITNGKYDEDFATGTKKMLYVIKHTKFRSFIETKGFNLILNLPHDFKRIVEINHRRNHYENHEIMISDLSKHKKYGLYVTGGQDNITNMHQIYFDVIWGGDGEPVGVIMVWFQVVTKYVSMLGCNGFQH